MRAQGARLVQGPGFKAPPNELSAKDARERERETFPPGAERKSLLVDR